jgi:hypothetical protein
VPVEGKHRGICKGAPRVCRRILQDWIEALKMKVWTLACSGATKRGKRLWQ